MTEISGHAGFISNSISHRGPDDARSAELCSSLTSSSQGRPGPSGRTCTSMGYRAFKGDIAGAPFRGDIDTDIDVEVDVGIDIDSYLGCLKRVSKSVQVLLNGTGAVVVLTLMSLK